MDPITDVSCLGLQKDGGSDVTIYDVSVIVTDTHSLNGFLQTTTGVSNSASTLPSFRNADNRDRGSGIA